MPMQFTDFSEAVKIENFQWKMFDIFLDLLKLMIVCIRQNRLGEAVLMSDHNLCFGTKIRKDRYTAVYPRFVLGVSITRICLHDVTTRKWSEITMCNAVRVT